jgi:hypothetical protein
MVSVRHRLARGAGIAAAAACVLASCNRKKEEPVDTATPPPIEEAPALPPVVLPTWSADTSTFALDRPSAITPQFRTRVKRCTDTTPVVTADSVGPLFPGQTFEQVIRACPRAMAVYHFDDGRYGPALAVMLGRALVVADLEGTNADARVTRVAAFDRAKTADGIGPGSSLSTVRQTFGAPTWRRFQCSVDALFDTRPGLVIRISLPEEGSDAIRCTDLRRLAEGPDFSNFPRGSRVGWIATELPGVR